MEGLAPPLKCLLWVRMGLENGNAIRGSLKEYLDDESDEFSKNVIRLLFDHERGQLSDEWICLISSPYRRILLQVLGRGLSGQPILSELQALEEEILAASRREIDRQLQRLPILTMIPLLLFQFPAFLMLLIGPILLQLLRGLQ